MGVDIQRGGTQDEGREGGREWKRLVEPPCTFDKWRERSLGPNPQPTDVHSARCGSQAKTVAEQ
jgi:hypothetical protein